MDHKQGVHFITTSPQKPDRVLYNVTFDPTEGDFLFDFKAAWCSMKIVVLFSILSDLNRFIVKNEGGWVIFDGFILRVFPRNLKDDDPFRQRLYSADPSISCGTGESKQ